MQSIRPSLSLMACAVLLSACATPRPTGTQPVWTPAPPPAQAPKSDAAATTEPSPAPVTPKPAPASTVLAAEYDWLRLLFGPTPVRLAHNGDGSISLWVPMQYAFDPAGATPKPALQAVLGKLAESMARQPQATLLSQVPGAMPRALAVRDALTVQGVPAGRVASSTAPADGPDVVLRLVP